MYKKLWKTEWNVKFCILSCYESVLLKLKCLLELFKDILYSLYIIAWMQNFNESLQIKYIRNNFIR